MKSTKASKCKKKLREKDAWLVLTIDKNRLVIKINLPTRLTLMILATFAAVSKYPAIAAIVSILLDLQ